MPQPRTATNQTSPATHSNQSEERKVEAFLTVCKQYLNTREAAEFLNVSKDFLQALRTRGGGPVYAKYGQGRTAPIRYAVHDLEEWHASQKRKSTSDPGSEAA